MNEANYTPYCGGDNCYMPRTVFRPIDGQFICPNCKWISNLPKEFIDRYRLKWNK